MHTSVRNKLISLIALALIVVLGFVFALDNKQQSTIVSEQQRAFPEFTSSALVNSEGVSGQQKITLADVTQHPYQLVNVWASWCGICKTDIHFCFNFTIKAFPSLA
eukprot:TRINITY_DN7453_c0_g1_i1.p1 TRINITY_DN7453_c0_g1~~TRINITY_DN7453_c0_g1_i1.p1  ORF type:complete len:106 (+),score=5.14 TRINITY_DN7453_c0_g1_i1:198-515(+)